MVHLLRFLWLVSGDVAGAKFGTSLAWGPLVLGGSAWCGFVGSRRPRG